MRYYRNSLLLGTSAYRDNYMGAMQYYGNRHQPSNVTADSNGVVMRGHGNKQSSFNKEKRRSFVSKSSKNLGTYLRQEPLPDKTTSLLDVKQCVGQYGTQVW